MHSLFSAVAIVPFDGIILEATGCAHLWGSEEAYLRDIISRLEAKGYHAKAAIADTIGAVWAICRFGKEIIVEKGKQLEAILFLPPEALRLDENIVERLYKLGLNKIEPIIAIPPLLAENIFPFHSTFGCVSNRGRH